jgi:hypothetical protein
MISLEHSADIEEENRDWLFQHVRSCENDQDKVSQLVIVQGSLPSTMAGISNWKTFCP